MLMTSKARLAGIVIRLAANDLSVAVSYTHLDVYKRQDSGLDLEQHSFLADRYPVSVSLFHY